MENLFKKNSILKVLEENLWMVMLFILFFTIGMVLGVYTVKYMNNNDMNNLNDYFSLFIQNIKGKQFNSRELILEAVKNNAVIILIIWCSGFTILGVPFILIINTIKGYTLGFAFSFIIATMGYKSIGIAILSLIPQNIIYVACMIIISVVSFKLSLDRLKNKFIKTSPHSNNKNVVQYLYSFIIVSVFMFLGFFIEGLFTPNLIRFIIAR